MRFSVRSIFLVITILALATSLIDFSSLRFHPIQEHLFPTEDQLELTPWSEDEHVRQLSKWKIYFGTREPKWKGDAIQLTYVVVTQDSRDLTEEKARKLAKRFPRRQLHQVINGNHTSTSRRISWADFQELLAITPYDFRIDVISGYAERRKHWQSRGLDLSAYWGETGFEMYSEMCERAFQRDREEVLAWLRDYPAKHQAGSCFYAMDATHVPFEKAIWLLDQLGNDDAYTGGYYEVGYSYFDVAQGKPHPQFLSWVADLPQSQNRRSAITGMMLAWSETSNIGAFQYALQNLKPDDFDAIDKLCEQSVPPEQIARAFAWWSARDRFLGNEPYSETSMIAFNSASLEGIRAALQMEDTELVDHVLPEMFRGWEWNAGFENTQSELSGLAQLWSTLTIDRQLGTVESLLEAFTNLEPDRIPDFVATLEDARLREVAGKALARIAEWEEGN